MHNAFTAHLLLRLGVAFAFIYPAIAAYFDPVSWLSYMPSFVRVLPVDSLILLHGFGFIEIVLALWVLSGWKIRTPAILMTLMLVGIVVFNWAQIDVLFRDLSIAAMTLILALSPEKSRTSEPSALPPSRLAGPEGPE